MGKKDGKKCEPTESLNRASIFGTEMASVSIIDYNSRGFNN